MDLGDKANTMHRNFLAVLFLCILLFDGTYANVNSTSKAENSSGTFELTKPLSSVETQPVSLQSEKQDSENKGIVTGQPEAQPSDRLNSEVNDGNMQNSRTEDTDDHSDIQVSKHQSSMKENKEADTNANHQSDTNIKSQSIARQFYPPPYHQSMLFQPPTGFEAIRRQFGSSIGSDIVMMGLISLPIIGLLTLGSASFGNLLGLGASSSSKKSSSKRTRRSLKDKAADAVEYAKNLWNVMEQLERAFEKHDLYQAECRLRVVCEAHHKDRKMGSWGQSILDLMRQQKELEGRELLPVSRFLFSNYAEAAQAGARNENCSQLYTGCPKHLSYYLSAKEDQLENEIENDM